MHGNPVKAKVSGSDLVPQLCSVAVEKRYSIFIIGGKDGVAEKAKIRLKKYIRVLTLLVHMRLHLDLKRFRRVR